MTAITPCYTGRTDNLQIQECLPLHTFYVPANKPAVLLGLFLKSAVIQMNCEKNNKTFLFCDIVTERSKKF